MGLPVCTLGAGDTHLANEVRWALWHANASDTHQDVGSPKDEQQVAPGMGNVGCSQRPGDAGGVEAANGPKHRQNNQPGATVLLWHKLCKHGAICTCVCGKAQEAGGGR